MNLYWIWFSRINKIGAKVQKELINKYKSPEKIWKLTKKDLIKNNLKQETIDIILNKKYRENLEYYNNYMQKQKINMITINDKKYPQKLKNIYDPPIVLYIKGNMDILNNNSLAIIGSRSCSEYGKKIATNFSYNISKNNINIISGLARGIDTYAHKGTICAKCKTIAVIGSGIDLIYPAENTKLANEIIQQGGAIISEYIIGTKPDKTNFPARNRIISGLSDGILVVEASKKSGTNITVDFALEQGKNVYAIPGNIYSYVSSGTNELIKQGATLVTTEQDILGDFC